MAIPGPHPADGDPPDDPSAEQAGALRADAAAHAEDETRTPRTEHPVPEGVPSGTAADATP